jgi:hypothetical protein
MQISSGDLRERRQRGLGPLVESSEEPGGSFVYPARLASELSRVAVRTGGM